MNYGYVRISRPKQNIERQIRNIKSMCPDKSLRIIVETYTGRTQDRPNWRKYYPNFKKGDNIYFDSVSRMSRTADEGVAEYMELNRRGINLFFGVEPHINTDVYKESCNIHIPKTGTDTDIILEAIEKYQMKVAETQIRIAFQQAEKEVQDLSQRVKGGLETARLNGKTLGRPKGQHYKTEKEVQSKKKMLKRAQAFGGDLKDSDCMKVIGISKGTYYRYKKELLIEREINDNKRRI